MVALWLTAWLVANMPRPDMFGTSWDAWGLTLTVSAVFDLAFVRDWWYESHRVSGGRVRLGAVVHFLRHFVEMGVAMVLGMYAMGLAAPLLGPPETRLTAMALFMAAPMVAWMRFRRHSWERSIEMAGAMFLPALLAVGLHLAGLLSVATMRGLGHDLMWFAMLGLMLWRWPDYAHIAHDEAMVMAPG